MKIYQPGTIKVHHRIALYGAAKRGKTRLATSLPWGPKWGERAIYVAFDPGSEELGSVLPHNREHLIVVKPEVEQMESGRLRYDPLDQAIKIATYDWKKDFPDVNTIIWDTATETSFQLLSAYSDSGVFSEKHVAFGKPGTAAYHTAPMEGDYGAAQRSTAFILEHLDRQPMHKIVIFHDEWDEPKEGKGGATLGGPALAGKKGTKLIARRYDDLFRVDAMEKVVPPNRVVTKYYVHTQPQGIWVAGFRTPLLENPFPKYELPPDPIPFWNELDKIRGDSDAAS